MDIDQKLKAITEFATDLKNSCEMRDRQNAVIYLSNKIGSEAANQIAAIFGLTGSYYQV